MPGGHRGWPTDETNSTLTWIRKKTRVGPFTIGDQIFISFNWPTPKNLQPHSKRNLYVKCQKMLWYSFWMQKENWSYSLFARLRCQNGFCSPRIDSNVCFSKGITRLPYFHTRTDKASIIGSTIMYIFLYISAAIGYGLPIHLRSLTKWFPNTFLIWT